jgi:Flp pilus assembly protein TadG
MGASAFAIDGGQLYAERRSAQNAADHAALVAAFTECTGGTETSAIQAGVDAAAANRFNNDGTTNTVSVTRVAQYHYLAVIDTNIDATFSKVMGASTLATGAQAVASCTPGSFQGEALFGGSTTCTRTISVEGEGLLVNGGTHSNNDLIVSAQNSSFGGSTTHVGGFQDTGTNNTFDSLTGGVGTRSYPIDFQFSDYQPGGSVALAAGSQYADVSIMTPPGTSWNTANQEWTLGGPPPVQLAPGVYYSPGRVVIGSHVTIGAASGGNFDGVTFVASGPIIFTGDVNPGFDAWGSSVNQGLVVFSNHPGTPTCDTVAISIQGNTNVFNGIIFGPNGRIDARGNSASSFGAVWGNQVKLQGNTFSVTGPVIGTGGDPRVTLDE